MRDVSPSPALGLPSRDDPAADPGSPDAVARLRALLRSTYYGRLHQLIRSRVPPGGRVLDVGCGDGSLLAALRPSRGLGVDGSPSLIAAARNRHPELEFRCADIENLADLGSFDHIVVSNAVGRVSDVWAFFRGLRPLVAPGGRVVVTYYNFAWEPALSLMERLGLKGRTQGQNWLSAADLANLLELAGFRPVQSGYRTPIPAGPRWLSSPLNAALEALPPLQRLGIISYTVAVPEAGSTGRAPATCSVIIPARNERGNIRAAIERMPALGSSTEVIFVEGHSSDGTAAEIARVIEDHPGRNLRLLRQGSQRGKGAAVRQGFDAATGDVLMILDADLTVPPEDLPKFWLALTEDRGDLINGSRLVYPMERQAMRLANLAANKVFGLLFSWILRQRVTDTLCGTKALRAEDYGRIRDNRPLFGDFDPFGDFDLLFGAAHLGLRIREVPIRYRERTYGRTQISRWRHGVLLLGMTVTGMRKLRLGGVRRLQRRTR